MSKHTVTMDDALARLIRIMGTFDLATGHADTMDQALDALEEELRDVLGHLRARREQQRESEWVGLTDEEIEAAGHLNVEGERMLPYSFARAIEAKLREKNA